MTTPHTTSQLRALEMFHLMVNLPQDNHFARASAVAHCLAEEQINVSGGWFRQITLPDTSIVDIELLEIDGAMVDVKGIHQDWEAVASAYQSNMDGWLSPAPKLFYAGDPDWLGVRGSTILAGVVVALSSELQQQALDASTPASPSFRPSARL